MVQKLCVHWEYDGGKGDSSPKPASERHHLETWVEQLRYAYPDGHFSIKEIKPNHNILVREFK